MSIEEFLEAVPTLTGAQLTTVERVATELSQERFEVVAWGDATQETTRYHRAVAEVNATPKGAERLRVWGAVNGISSSTARRILRTAGEALLIADALSDESLAVTTAPFYAAVGIRYRLPVFEAPALTPGAPEALPEADSGA